MFHALIGNLVLIILDEILQLHAADARERFLRRQRVAQTKTLVARQDLVRQLEESEVLHLAVGQLALQFDDLAGELHPFAFGFLRNLDRMVCE